MVYELYLISKCLTLKKKKRKQVYWPFFKISPFLITTFNNNIFDIVPLTRLIILDELEKFW